MITPKVWPLTPDWSSPVRETLSWSTQAHEALATGHAQHIARRVGPRRSFEFELVHGGQERRLADLLLSDAGTRPWWLPVWPDVQWLSGVNAAATVIPCDTVGIDFVVGGHALLYLDSRTWSLVEIEAIDDDGITLTAPLESAWPAGSRVYPVRRAIADASAQSWRITDTVDRARLRFNIDEPCDWPAVLPVAEYAGYPLLSDGPDWSSEAEVSYLRIAGESNAEETLPAWFDTARIAIRRAGHAWSLVGRAERAGFRSLLYGLRGAQAPMWVPSWSSDLLPVETIGAADDTLTIEWCGYAEHGLGRVGRRDIRVELRDGTVLCRRIVAATGSGNTEVLQIDAPLGLEITPQHVRRVSYLALSVMGADQVSIDHETDSMGLARVATSWRGVRPDV